MAWHTRRRIVNRFCRASDLRFGESVFPERPARNTHPVNNSTEDRSGSTRFSYGFQPRPDAFLICSQLFHMLCERFQIVWLVCAAQQMAASLRFARAVAPLSKLVPRVSLRIGRSLVIESLWQCQRRTRPVARHNGKRHEAIVPPWRPICDSIRLRLSSQGTHPHD
jgi:hypothetical protein